MRNYLRYRDQVMHSASQRQLRARLNAAEAKLRRLRASLQAAPTPEHRVVILDRMRRVREGFSEYYRRADRGTAHR